MAQQALNLGEFVVATGLTRKPGNICVVLDERLSRERAALFTRAINTFRTFTTVDVTETVDENLLLQKLGTQSYDLVLLPWYHYLEWKRAEGFWGLTRTSGPTIAGYFCEPLLPHELGQHAEHNRAILLDFANLTPPQISLLIKSLQKDTLRSGIKPLLDLDSKIYCENWYGSQGLGERIDSVLGVPELSDPKWAKRAASMRICLNALWSLVYEEGPGKADVSLAATSSPKAYFQFSCDRDIAVMRLCYQMPSCTPTAALSEFWPDPKAPTAAGQLLLKYADFLRVHTFSNLSGIEVVAGLFPSAPCEQAHDQVHTLWVEPLAEQLFTEPPEIPSPASPRLRPLPSGAAQQETRLRLISNLLAEPEPPAELGKVEELKSELQKKDQVIRELKAGGVGTAPPLPPPEPEALIEAFQERYFDARFQIRQLELEIVAMEKKGATPEEIHNIRLKMEALANREQSWIKKLATTLAEYKAARKKG